MAEGGCGEEGLGGCWWWLCVTTAGGREVSELDMGRVTVTLTR